MKDFAKIFYHGDRQVVAMVVNDNEDGEHGYKVQLTTKYSFGTFEVGPTFSDEDPAYTALETVEEWGPELLTEYGDKMEAAWQEDDEEDDDWEDPNE